MKFVIMWQNVKGVLIPFARHCEKGARESIRQRQWKNNQLKFREEKNIRKHDFFLK